MYSLDRRRALLFTCITSCLLLSTACSGENGLGDGRKAAELAHADQLAEALGQFELNDPAYCAFLKAPARAAVVSLVAGINPYREQVKADTANAYATTFTPAELGALARFYETPEGRSIAQKTAV